MRNPHSETPSASACHWVRTSEHKPETVVLLHAVGHDLTYYDRQIEALHDGYNVVAVDLPGHGLSPALPGPWSFDEAAAIIADVIEQTSPAPVHLVGLSFGGMLAQVTTLARPDLIRSLTLIGTAPDFPDVVRATMRARAATVRASGMSAIIPSSLERWLTADTRAHRPDLVDRMTKTLLGDDRETHAAIWDLIATLDFRSRLGEIRCPTLVLVGEHDPSTPPSVAHGLRESIPGAALHVIPKASHIVTVEAPDAVNTALKDFLQSLSYR